MAATALRPSAGSSVPPAGCRLRRGGLAGWMDGSNLSSQETLSCFLLPFRSPCCLNTDGNCQGCQQPPLSPGCERASRLHCAEQGAARARAAHPPKVLSQRSVDGTLQETRFCGRGLPGADWWFERDGWSERSNARCPAWACSRLREWGAPAGLVCLRVQLRQSHPCRWCPNSAFTCPQNLIPGQHWDKNCGGEGKIRGPR